MYYLFFFCLMLSSAPGQDATEIVRRAEQHMKGNTSSSQVDVLIVRPNWSREMSMKTWSKGNDYVMILVTAPAREKGIVYLKRDKEVWNWIPSIERNIKLPPSMMSQSWIGTDFTNDDLVKEASITEDYFHRIIRSEAVAERDCYLVEMTPRPESAVVWGRVLLWIDKKDYLMMKAEYYDEDGELVNSMICSEVRLMGGRLLPARMEMVPAEKKGNKTVLLYRDIVFDKPIDDAFFSVDKLPYVK